MAQDNSSGYKWYVLGLGFASHVLVYGMAKVCMPVLFDEIAAEMGLSLVQVGVIWGMMSLPGMFVAFAGGLAIDRFGAAHAVSIICLAMGIFGALRGVAGDFTSLAAFSFLFSLFAAPLAYGTHKTAGEWFSGRQLGMANGVLAMGMGGGAMLGSLLSATVLSPALGGWRNLMFVFGAVAVIIGLLWLRVRPHPGHAGTATGGKVPFRQALSHVLRIKEVWLLALAMLFFNGYLNGLVGYLPLYLRSAEWPPIGADGALAALSAASVLGVVPLSLLSDKIGLRKTVILPALAIIIAAVTMLILSSSPPAVWPAVIMAGVFQEFVVATIITMIMETEGIGAAYTGTALGVFGTLSGLGGFFGPSLGNAFAETRPAYAFCFWLGLVVMAVIIFFFIRETGWKKKPALKPPL